MARLFKGFSGYFCRPCCGDPVYESQRRSKKARAYLQAYRTRQQIGGSRPVTDPLPERPYRMKRKTYARLCDRIERLERPLVGSRILRQRHYGSDRLPIDFDNTPERRQLDEAPVGSVRR